MTRTLTQRVLVLENEVSRLEREIAAIIEAMKTLVSGFGEVAPQIAEAVKEALKESAEEQAQIAPRRDVPGYS